MVKCPETFEEAVAYLQAKGWTIEDFEHEKGRGVDLIREASCLWRDEHGNPEAVAQTKIAECVVEFTGGPEKPLNLPDIQDQRSMLWTEMEIPEALHPLIRIFCESYDFSARESFAAILTVLRFASEDEKVLLPALRNAAQAIVLERKG